MLLHLFSSGGETPFEHILEAARPLLEGKPDALVAYLPAASLQPRWVRATKAAFRGLAGVTALNVERHSPARMRAVLDKAALLFVPGGNTYLIAHRLHTCCGGQGLIDELRQRILAGLPLVGISAGSVLCGPDILTTNDINGCGSTHFAGLGVIPFNINAHYPTEDEARLAREERMQEYLAFHASRTILAIEDSAWLEVTTNQVKLKGGTAWKIAKDQAGVQLETGSTLAIN